MSKQLNLWDEKCEICNIGKCEIIWDPFGAGWGLSYEGGKICAENMSGICRDCQNRIFKMRRSNAEVFGEATTIQDVIQIVRKAFDL